MYPLKVARPSIKETAAVPRAGGAALRDLGNKDKISSGNIDNDVLGFPTRSLTTGAGSVAIMQ
jgi:hypothetical protein